MRYFFNADGFTNGLFYGTRFAEFRDLIFPVHDDFDLFLPEFMTVQC